MADDASGRVNPEVVRAIGQIAEHVAQRPFSRDLVHRLEWLVEILVDRGYLLPEHRALINRSRGDSSMVRLATYPEKRKVIGIDPGCAERVHLCQARCCAMEIALSAEDIAEGKLGWELNQPYLLAKADHGNCTHLQADGRCGVYEHRPAMCRAYDCVDDARIWIDYDQMIPAPMPWWLVPLDQRNLPPEEWAALIAARFAEARPPLDADGPTDALDKG